MCAYLFEVICLNDVTRVRYSYLILSNHLRDQKWPLSYELALERGIAVSVLAIVGLTTPPN